MTKYPSNIVLILLVFIFLAGCQTTPHGMEKVLVKGGDFWITTYQKITDKNAPFVFYIEGDGAAFYGKSRVSINPTPRRQMLINLAAIDERPNVVYVARPCQYTPRDLDPKCSSQYWTNKRMSDDIVRALNDAVNSVNNNKQKFSLVGYSGGGSIAVLIAARNPMVRDIITIAGNLDHKLFTTHHNVPTMDESLNPIDYVSQVRNVPQLHISGGKDTVVPPFIAEKFIQKAASPCVKQQIFEGVSHKGGWEKIWKDIYTKPLTCNN